MRSNKGGDKMFGWLKTIFGALVGWWECPQCSKRFIGLSVDGVKTHAESHGLSDLGALCIVDLVLNLGGSGLYPTKTQKEVVSFFNEQPVKAGGLPTWRLF